MKQVTMHCHSNSSLLFVLLLVITLTCDTIQSFSLKPCKHGRKINLSFQPKGIDRWSSIGTSILQEQKHGSFPLRMRTSTTTSNNNHNINTNNSGVIFRYSASSLDHLKTIQESNASKQNDSTSATATATTTTTTTTTSSGRLKATIGALTLATLTGILTLYLTTNNNNNNTNDINDNPLFLCTAVAAGVAGWKLCGGDLVREAEKPKDGGYDARFVVDLPIRLSSIIDRIQCGIRNDNYDDDDGNNDDGNNDEFLVQLVQSSSIQNSSNDDEDDFEIRREQALRLMEKVHDAQYLHTFREAVADAKQTDRVRRLNPTVMRTLIDQYSYDAAVNSVMDWMHAVDTALMNPPLPMTATTTTTMMIGGGGGGGGGDDCFQRGTVEFALVRPPSHHACKSRGMGGCMLNSAAIAAQYALEKGMKNVAILDIDAHHGNGIAHCIQEEERVRYCSIHEVVVEKNWFKNEEDARRKEESDDPRGAGVEDCGPLGNILNVPLDKKTGWDDGYRDALVEKALPFLLGRHDEETILPKPDILIVACGFDALSADRTSSLQLLPEDYAKIGSILYDHFGCRVAFGLEGGYCWEGGELGEAVVNLVKPWSSSS